MTNYGIGNWGLPELGVTEFFGGNDSSVGNAQYRTAAANLPQGPMSYFGPEDVLGVSDQRTPTQGSSTQTNTSSSNSGSNSGSSSGGMSSEERRIREEQDRIRRSINSGYDDYFNYLDNTLSGLGGQRNAQQGIIESSYNSSLGDLGLQRQQGLQSLDSNRQDAQYNQNSNLRDIANNIRNQFMAGNVYLGARGAGDSSASNQYSYALNKMGTQQRSNVMGDTARILADVNARQADLENIYNNETNKLKELKNTRTQELAMWFDEQQNALQRAKAEGSLARSADLRNLSTDILNRAIAELDRINSQTMARQQMLDQWAMGQSENVNQLRQNMQSVSNAQYSMPQAGSLAGLNMGSQARGLAYQPGSSAYGTREKDPFGGYYNAA